MKRNIDPATVEGFGREWHAYDQTSLSDREWAELFDRYFRIFPWSRLPAEAEGFDLGCGSGRWAAGVAPRVARLHCIDPAAEALAVARNRLGDHGNVQFHLASSDAIPLADGSQDFGYSLGVLHHAPDPMQALKDCVRKLRPGAPFLLYIYYALDDRPGWFRGLWKASDMLRAGISRLPFPLRKAVSTAAAALVYWPLARGAGLAERFGLPVAQVPLSSYRSTSFYSMRTDALDRFGTRLEHRFTRAEIDAMMRTAGLGEIVFSDDVPYWVACGIKA